MKGRVKRWIIVVPTITAGMSVGGFTKLVVRPGGGGRIGVCVGSVEAIVLLGRLVFQWRARTERYRGLCLESDWQNITERDGLHYCAPVYDPTYHNFATFDPAAQLHRPV